MFLEGNLKKLIQINKPVKTLVLQEQLDAKFISNKSFPGDEQDVKITAQNSKTEATDRTVSDEPKGLNHR